MQQIGRPHPGHGNTGVDRDLTREAHRWWPGSVVTYEVSRTGGYVCRLERLECESVELGTTKKASSRALYLLAQRERGGE